MHVFRHHHILDQLESVSGTYFIKYFHKAIAHTPCPQKRAPTVTTKSHKVEIASSAMASQRNAHRRKTRTLKPEGCGTPPSPIYMG